MVAIVSGNGLGLSLTSLATLGQRGLLEGANAGRGADRAFVNVATGNLVLQAQDDRLMGRGLSASALRTYNSQGQFTDDNGDNWIGSPLKRVVLSGSLLMAGSTVTRVDQDGASATYTFDASRNRYVSTAGDGAHDQISFDYVAGQFVWTDGATGVVERYESSADGRILAMRDTSGNQLSYAYNAAGHLARVTSSSGESIHYDYTGNLLTQVRTEVSSGSGTQTLTRVRYAYDAQSRLASVTVDLTPEDGSVADGRVYTTTYTYEGSSTRIATMAQSDGSQLTFTYVQVGADHRVASIANGLGQVTGFSYNTSTRQTTVTSPLGLQTVYAYDTQGQLTGITAPPVGGEALTTSFSYNANGDVVRVVDPEGKAIDMAYDANGNQVLQRDHAGNTVTRTFDESNRLLTETAYAAADPDGAGTAQPSQPQTTRYVYDATERGLLRFVLSPEGRVTEHRYNAFGERVSTVQYAAAAYDVSGLAATAVPSEGTMAGWVSSQDRARTLRSDMVYDSRGQLQRLTQFSRVDASGNGVADGSQSVTHYVYDAGGRLLQTVSATNGMTSFAYDGLGREISRIDALGQATITAYDDANNRTRTTLAHGLIVTHAYDRAGRLVSVADSNAAAQSLGETRYLYDANGRLRMVEDPTGVRLHHLYDEAGRKTAEIDGNGSLTEYRYNRNGQLTHTIAYATAVSTASLLNAQGQPNAVAVASIRPASHAQDRKTWYVYDDANRLAKTVDAAGAVTETVYDGVSQVVRTIRYANTIATVTLGNTPASAAVAPAASSADRVSRNFYDADGRLRAQLDGEGFLTDMRYNAAGLLVETVRFANATPVAHRASGTLAQLMPSAHANDQRTVFFHDARGQVIAEVDAEQYLTEKVYDSAGNLTQTVRYANRVTATVTTSSTVASLRPASHAEDRTTSWTYDQLNRVTREVNAEGTDTRYEYDSAGRLVKTTRAFGTAEVRSIVARYDLQGRLTGELSAEGAALLTGGQTQAQIDAVWTQHGVHHTYDAAGRRTSTTNALGHRSFFFYNVDGQLTHTVNALGEVEEHRYNTLNQLEATTRYGTRISTSGLTGGIVSTTLTNALNAVRNVALDSTTTYTYNVAGRMTGTADALGFTTSVGYNAFGEEVTRTQSIDASRSLTQTRQYDRRGLELTATSDPAGINAATTKEYDAFGRLVRTVDPRGNARAYAYDRLGRSVTVTDPLGGLRSTSYDAFDRVLTQTDALGNVTTYTYNKTARSLAVRTPESITVTTVRNRHGEVHTVTDGRGLATTYTYDRNGNLLRTDTPMSGVSTHQAYDRANRLIETTDAVGTKVSYTYDAANRTLTRRVDPTGLNLLTQYSYDARGQQIEVRDPKNVVTRVEYDLKGQVTRQTVDPTGLNLVTSFTYDRRGATLTVTNPGGTVTQYAYDTLGRRTQERVDPSGLNLTRNYTYDKNGNLTSRTDPNGAVTRFAYDAADRRVFEVGALGQVQHTAYDAEGRIVKTTRYTQAISLSGLPAAPSVADVQSRLVSTPASDLVEHRVYDRDGRQVATVDGTGGVVRFTYDANGNVIERRAHVNRVNLGTWTPGSVPAPATNAADERQRTVYDALNRAIFQIDGAGAVVETRYDADDTVIERIAYATTVPVGTAATQAAIASAVSAVANPARDLRERNFYDRAKRLVWTVNGVGSVTQNTYDANGNVVRVIRYATAISPSASPTTVVANAADRRHAYAYDAANRLVLEADPVGTARRSVYDKNSKLTQRIEYATALSDTVINSLSAATSVPANAANDRVLRFAYDAASREIFRVDSLGGTTETWYDAAGNALATKTYAAAISLSGLSATASVNDIRSRLAPNATADRMHMRAYDAAGRVVYEVDPIQHVKYTQYDGAGRVVSTTQYATTILASTANNTTAIAAALVANASVDRTQTHTYDAAGRLLSTRDPLGHTESYTYDGAGRRLTLTNKLGAVWTYAYDAASRLVTETSPAVALTTVRPGAGGSLIVDEAASATTAVVTRLEYDALGNLTARVEGAGRPEERRTQYEYDAAGRQIRTLYPSVAVYNAQADNLTVNGATGVATRTETQVQLYTRTYYDALGNAVANRDVAGNHSYKAYDRLGNVRYEVDALGHVTGYTRNAFGETTQLIRYAQATTLAGTTLSIPSVAQIESAISASNGANRLLTTEYDQLGRVTRVVEPTAFSYDSRGTTTSTQYMEAGKVTRNTYNALSDLIQVSVLRNSATNTWDNTHHYYNQRGERTASVDAMGYVARESYDAYGNVVERVEFVNAAASWNASGYTLGATHADDRRVTFVFDRGNRKTSETRHSVLYTNGTSGTHTRGNLTTTYAYDAVGNQTRVTDASGAATLSYYDALGRVSAVAAPSTGNAHLTMLTHFRRDVHGNVVAKTESVRYKLSAGANPFDAIGPSYLTPNQTLTTGQSLYSPQGRYQLVMQADGNLVLYDRTTGSAVWHTHTWTTQADRFVFQSDGNLVLYKGSQAVWSSETYGTGPQYLSLQEDGNLVLYGANWNPIWQTGNQTAITNYLDRVTLSSFDSHGREIQTKDAEGHDSFRSYNSQGLLAKEWRGVTDANGTRTLFRAYEYDALGRQTTIQDPASTTVLRGGLQASFTSATRQTDFDGNATVSGTNRVNLTWSSLVDPQGGLVRVQVDYQTLSTYRVIGTDEYGNPITYGQLSQARSRTQDFAASGVAAGASLSWTESSTTAGGIDRLNYIRVWQQNASGAWVLAWEGTAAQATGSGVATVSQQAAGLVRTDIEYNAFGEMTRRGVNGGRQEYFDYDNAGRLWRTNAQDGIDRVTFYDLQGRATAEIRSAGSALGNRDLKVYASASALQNLSDVHRTDYVYDALGRVTDQYQAKRVVTQGGVTVRNTSTAVSVGASAQPSFDENGAVVGWSGTNTISLAWTTLAGLGSGDVRVDLNYVTRPVDTRVYDEYGGLISGYYQAGIATSRSVAYTAEAARTGVSMSWQDPAGSQGGVSSISRLRVYKKDHTGQWRLVVDRSAHGEYGHVIEVAAPANANSVVVLQTRVTGTSTWSNQSLVRFGDAYRFDTTGFAEGRYDYQVLVTDPGQPQRTVANGTVDVVRPPLISISTPMSFNPASIGVGLFAWLSPGSGVQQVLRYRAAGSTGAWTNLTVAARGKGYDGVDLRSMVGQYEFELLWTRAGEATPYAHSTGTWNLVAEVPPTNLPHVTGVGIGTVYVTGYDEAGQPTYGSTRTIVGYNESTPIYGPSYPSLEWPRAPNGTTVTFRTRPVGSTTWTNRTILLKDTNRQFIRLDGIAVGTYEFELHFRASGSSSTTSWSTGRLEIRSSGTPRQVITITTPPYTAGTPKQYHYTNTTASNSTAVSVTGAAAGADIFQTAVSNGDTRWLRPLVKRTYDRWGNVLSITDPRSANWVTRYTYNANNQVIQENRPDGDGNASSNSPIFHTYYDALGREVGNRDANGNLNTRTFDAAGNLVTERRADNTTVTHSYNGFGEKIKTRDPLGKESFFVYDKLGRLKEHIHGTARVHTVTSAHNLQFVAERAIVDRYTYDQAGRRLTHTNGNNETLRYVYDLRGNVVETIKPLAGTGSRSVFDANNRKVAEVDGNAYSQIWRYDHFGLLQGYTDLGGATYQYVYDNARQLTRQTNSRGQDLRYTYDAAGQLVRVQDIPVGKDSTYVYDLSGNRIREKTVQGGVAHQDNQLAYDALGRLRWVSDGHAWVQMTYDKQGNRTRIQTRVINGTDDTRNSDRWFQYDAMNRQTVADALNSAGDIGFVTDPAGNKIAQGHRITYDAAGNRLSDTYWGNKVRTSGGTSVIIGYDEDGKAIYGTTPTTYVREEGLVTEVYSYDTLNRLTGTVRDGTQVDIRYYDGAGRVVQSGPGAGLPSGYIAKLNEGVPAGEATGTETRINRFDANGQMLYQRVLKNRSDGQLTAKHNIDYRKADGTGNYDLAGNLLGYKHQNIDGGSYTNTYTHTWARYEGYKQGTTAGTSTQFNPGSVAYQYDANGHLVGITDSRMAANNRTYVNDAQGRILTSTYTQSANVQRQLIANGEVLGRHGVGIDPLKPRNSNGTPRFLAMADFNFGYQPINGNQIAASGGQHTVAAGDTLEMIARGAYGDGQLWYRIAEANGLTGNTDLVVGQTLVVPNNVSTNANNSDTWRPYNAAEMIGDTTPHLPVPKDSCGPMGQVLMIVVAVVVTIYTAGAAAGALGAVGTTTAGATTAAIGGAAMTGGGALVAGSTGFVLGSATATAVASAAIGGAVGSIASQLVGNAIGAVDGFSWKSVAMSALSSGVGSGLAGYAATAGQSTVLGHTVVRAAVANAATQGIAVATGLQRQFNWMSVAASAVGAGVGSSVNGAVAGPLGDTFGGRLATGVLSGAAAGVATSLMRGGRVATVQVMADAFGNALGNSIVDEMRFSVAQAPTAGGGLKLKPGTAESWGPKLSFGGDVQLPRDYSLSSGAEVRFSTDGMETAAGPDNGPRTGVAGKEAAQGAWGIAKSLAGAGASKTEINRIKNQLLTLNPELAKSVRVGQEYVLPDADTPENTALAQQADQRYAAAQEQARARAEAHERARIDQLLASAGPRGGAFLPGNTPPPDAIAQSREGTRDYYAALQDRAVSSGRPGLFFAAKVGSLASDVGHDFAEGARGIYRLFTDASARAAAVDQLKFIASNPGLVVDGAIDAAKDFAAKPFDQQAESVFKGGLGLLAGAGTAKVGSAVGGVAVRRGVGEATNTGMLRQTGGGGSLGAADDLYASIRASTSDVSSIAANTGIKPANIQKVKDHVFYNEHLLDKYVDYGIPAVKARFDSDITQAQAWGRLENGTHTAQDITWLKHETAERWYELRHNSGYTAAHNAAEKKWSGNPWGSN